MAASRATRRFGYAVAIAVNAVLLVVVNNLLEWGWFSWLTDDFELVVPLVNASLVATILVTVAYLFYDPAWFKAATQILVNVIGLGVIVRMLRVFPFDFSAYDFNWAAVARGVLIVGLLGVIAGTIAEVVKLIRSVRTFETASR